MKAVGLTIDATEKAITKDLPFFLDLLTLSVEAGLDFAAAIGKVVERGRKGPLADVRQEDFDFVLKLNLLAGCILVALAVAAWVGYQYKQTGKWSVLPVALSPEEKEQVLQRYGIKPYQLPQILSSDPCVKAIGAVPGDIIRITKKSPTAGISHFYRYVVEG